MSDDFTPPPLEPPVLFADADEAAPAPPFNRILNPADIRRDPFASVNRGIAGLIAVEKEAGEQRSFVYPSKVWEYPWALTRHPLPEGELVLDAGCGVSTLPIYLAAHGAHVVALDNDMRWLQMEAVAARFHGLGVVPVLGDLTSLAFPDETFDRVYCISVLEHVDPAQQHAAIQEMARVLRPGGVLYLTVDYDESTRRADASDVVYDRDTLQRQAIVPSGLEIEGTTRYGCDDWESWRLEMRSFKLHSFGAMGVTLRKPLGDGPESASAIARRRAAWTDFATIGEGGDVARSMVASPGALPGLAPEDERPWVAVFDTPAAITDELERCSGLAMIELPAWPHEELRAAVLAAHRYAPEVPVCAYASVEEVTDGLFDGTGLDLYGVRLEAPTPVNAITRLRGCIARGLPVDLARANGYQGLLLEG